MCSYFKLLCLEEGGSTPQPRSRSGSDGMGDTSFVTKVS